MHNEYVVTAIGESVTDAAQGTPFLVEAEELARELFPDGGYRIWSRPVGVWHPVKEHDEH